MVKDDIYYQAMLARDYRFDGKFFVGVKTTGIYCRPICPAKPKRENVEFFTHALAAQKAGYRPCLRCHPEAAPSSPAWQGRSALVQRALKLISSGALLDADNDQFASRLGIGARHLRRVFVQEVGKTPKQISDGSRLDFARTLIIETKLPITTVALTAGFSSLRRFNTAFKTRFHRPPSTLRKKKTNFLSVPSSRGITLSLAYRPPHDWQSLLGFHHSHHIEGLESVDGLTFERVFKVDGVMGHLHARPIPEDSQLELTITADDPRVIFQITQRVRRMFDLDSDPLLIANQFSAHPLLDKLWKKFPGLRLPQGFDSFETTICTILGQLVSVEQARKLVAQLVNTCGEAGTHPLSGAPIKLFPSPQRLAQCSLEAIKTTQARKRALQELSRRVASGELSLSRAQDPEVFRKSLQTIPGIGPWSAQYVSMRALGDPDAFPGTDLILKRVTEAHPELNLKIASPWRAYAAIYLWKEYAQTFSKKKTKKKERIA